MLFGRAMSSEGQAEALWAVYRQLNAYFVRAEYADAFSHQSLPEDFVAAKFREGRDETENLSYVGQDQGFALIRDLPVWDVVARKMRVVGDLSR